MPDSIQPVDPHPAGRLLPDWAVSHWKTNGVTYVKDAQGDIYAGPYPTDSEGPVWMSADEDDADCCWQEDEKGLLEDAGTVGGDAQVGPAYSRRFWATDTPAGPGAALLFELVEVYGYAARDGENGPLVVQLQWGYSICGDRNDPGMTEQWADYLHEDVLVVGAGGVSLANELAREKVSQLAVEDFAAKAEEICRRAAMRRPGQVGAPPPRPAEPVRGCPRPQLRPGAPACWRGNRRPNGSLPPACEVCRRATDRGSGNAG